MFTFFVIIHVIICVVLILVVLLQAGRGGGLAGAFGGGGTAQSFFGSRGAATFLGKATAYLATSFMIMSLFLAVLSSRTTASGNGLLQKRAQQRAGQATLPPSTTTLDPSSFLDSLQSFLPDEGAGIGEASQSEESGAGPDDPPSNDPSDDSGNEAGNDSGNDSGE